MEKLQKEEEDFDFEGNRDETTFPIHMLAGSIAGLMEHVAIYPIDTIKVNINLTQTHMQTAKKKLKFVDTWRAIYEHGGISRFWRGSLLIGAASVPAHSLYFSVYEIMKKKLGVNEEMMNAPYSITTVMINENLKKIVEPKKRKFKFLSYFVCAAFAGACASIVTCPMDNIKTKLQTQNSTSTCEKVETMISDMKKDINSNPTETKTTSKVPGQNAFSTNLRPDCPTEPEIKYKNILSTSRMILAEDGFIKGFFRGLTPRVLSNAPSCAISWGTYEVVKHLLSARNNR